jgi:tetratricopeptide (TPR) repeat protein
VPATSDLDEIRASEAVRLFVDHARLVVPEFDVDEHNGAAIAEICRRLDGIALAIELAAARVRVLSIEDIRARLTDRFRLLTGGNRALPRHQTLHATMQWSHDLLTPSQQRLFRRLAVFAGGCTLAAATRVADDDSDEYGVLEHLTALHDKSLLVVDRDSQAQPRYRMLETVRQYAEERLNEAGESDEVRSRHLLHYVTLAEQAQPEMRGPRQVFWYETLRHEQENLVAAHAWCPHAPDGGELALRLAGSTWRYWTHSMQQERGYRLGAAALELGGMEGDSADRGRVLCGMAWHAMSMGRYGETLAFAERFLASARRIGDRKLLIDAMTIVAIGLNTTGQHSKAQASYEEALALARSTGDAIRLSSALVGLGELRRAARDWTGAEAFYKESLDAESATENPRGRAVSLCNLACVFIATERGMEARASLIEARSLARATGQKGLVECATDVVAALASSLGDHATAARLHGAMLRQLEEAGIRHDPVDEGFFEPWIARSRAAMGDAAFEAAQAGGWALSYGGAMAELDRWLEESTA